MNYKHSAVEKIFKILNSANRKEKNIWLYGECGIGKSETVKQVADKLGLDFYTMSLSAQTTVFKLTGFLDANSQYKATPLRLAYENGGLICLEECDTVNSGILAEINNMLSQKIYSFPDKTVEKHPDFKLICCANSNGKPTDIKYVKSQQIDTSILDRFVFVKMELEEDLAKILTNNEDWFNRVLKFRKVIKEVCGDDIVVGMRAMIDGADLLEAGFSQSEVEDMVIYKGIDEDVIENIKAKMDTPKPHSITFDSVAVDNWNLANIQKPSAYHTEDGLITLSDSNNDIQVWLDPSFCEQDNYELVEILKNELKVK